jgi:lipid-binding SYLF domain-containing protein
VLFKRNSVAGYYNSTAGSWGLQAGAQKFSYAMFFMTPDDLHYLDQSAGWELGATPGLTVLDKGFGTSVSSSTLQKGIYVFFFEQKGLMGGLSLQGTKVTKFHPKK